MQVERTTATEQEPATHQHAEAEEPEVQMCCDGSGRTAEQHRAESADHMCCSDH